MIVASAEPRYTPEDLLRMPDGDRFELIDGQLVEHTRSIWSTYVAGGVLQRLLNHCNANRLGWVFGAGASYQCFPKAPGRVRRSDVSFIRLDRLSIATAMAEGHSRIHPDLAVEVVSPNDVACSLDEKLQEYLGAGVALIWVVNPDSRVVYLHRPRGTRTILRAADELSGEDVVPGFRCRVAELFELPPGVEPAPNPI